VLFFAEMFCSTAELTVLSSADNIPG